MAPFALIHAVSCFGQALPSVADRLMATARLWTTVEYFHPALVRGDIDWNQALLTAIPKIRSAANTTEYGAAISSLLSELHDPETRVLETDPPVEASATARQWSRANSATESLFLVTEAPSPTQHISLDIAGARAMVRLSEAINTLPTAIAVQTRRPNDEDPFPSVELRLLAAFKTWGAIHYFFAYKDLMDEDWDADFTNALPKIMEARDATEYNLALADLMTHLTDTNSAPHSKILDTYFGDAAVGISMRLLDKYPIVTVVTDPAAIAAGVRPGDVLKRIGGESTTARFRRLVQYVTASTAQRSGYDTLQKVTNGIAGSELELMIENAKGESHPVRLERKNQSASPQRTTEAVRTMSGNIGYLDLDRLSLEAAEQAIVNLVDTKALILDLRGSAVAGELIAGHFTTQTNVPAALVTTPFPIHPDEATAAIVTQTTSTFLVQTMPAPRAPFYKGKTIALVDERTIGASEYAALLFEAANKTEFVGEPTAGAVGKTAELLIPGAITITYSTQDVRHANGGKLQRLGIQPNVLAPTTAKGLRAGKDEALDAAVAVLLR